MMRVFMRQLLKQQNELNDIDKRLAALSRRMDAMVDREAWALGELVEGAPRPDEPDQQVMSFDDEFFLFDDSNPEALLSDLLFDGTGPASGR